MASNFINTTRDHKFILKEWLDLNQIFATERFKNGYTVDDIDFILDNALKGAKEVVALSCEDSDTIGATYENGKVSLPQSSRDAYFFVQNNGLCSTNKDPNDPSAVPLTVLWSMFEYIVGANPGLATVLIGAGTVANIIEENGNDFLQKAYLKKLYSGEWTGTMCLTEPAYGSDVGDIVTKAIPTDEAGVYILKGNKCFISQGENGIVDNTIHLVLARIEGAAPGTKGLSLFVVPQYLTDADGNVGAHNDVNCVGIEHKLGLKGSPTCVMAFGEDNKCKGWLLGKNPLENGGAGEGMSMMFKVMNEERMMTGHAALSSAAVAYHNAAEYCRERIQGRQITNPKTGRVSIIKHEDVKRMLMFQKAHIEVFRAMVLQTFYYIDISYNSSDTEAAKKAADRVEVNTPLVKAYCSDKALECISEALQCYGGYGFSEEYPIAQIYRNARIYPIWEGTNFIQSMDLLGRKWSLEKGKVFKAWLMEIENFINNYMASPGFEREFEIMADALRNYKEIQATLGDYMGKGKVSMMPLYSTRILHATAKLYGGKLILDQALIAKKKMDELGSEHYDYAYYNGKVGSARFYVRNIVTEIETTLRIFKDGDTSALDVVEEAFFV